MIAVLMFADYDAAFGAAANVCVKSKWKNCASLQETDVCNPNLTFCTFFMQVFRFGGNTSFSFKLAQLPFSAQSSPILTSSSPCNPTPHLTVLIFHLLTCFFFSVSRRPTAASIVVVQAAPPALCVTAASCPCWPTASMSPSVICVAKPATPMVWRSASRAPANSTIWLTPMSGE